jgi:hypothetical protein
MATGFHRAASRTTAGTTQSVPGRRSTTSRCTRPSSRVVAAAIVAQSRPWLTSMANARSSPGRDSSSTSPGQVFTGTFGSAGGDAFRVTLRYARSNPLGSSAILSSSARMTASVMVWPRAGMQARQVDGWSRGAPSGGAHSKYATAERSPVCHRRSMIWRPVARFLFSQADFSVPAADAHHS